MTATGRKKGPTATALTAMMFETTRQVTNPAVTMWKYRYRKTLFLLDP